MHIKTASLSIACALALAACGGNDSTPAADRDVPAPATTPVTAPADTQPADAATMPESPVASTDAATPDAAATTDAAGDKPTATVSNCATTIEGNDAMQFDVGSIVVPASCNQFTINLRHTGRLPVTAMGHNVVISKAADRPAIAADGVQGGVDAGYLKADDERVIAHTELIGGGQETSVTFAVSQIQGDGPYEFFCSFPGHWTVMRGPIRVE